MTSPPHLLGFDISEPVLVLVSFTEQKEFNLLVINSDANCSLMKLPHLKNPIPEKIHFGLQPTLEIVLKN